MPEVIERVAESAEGSGNESSSRLTMTLFSYKETPRWLSAADAERLPLGVRDLMRDPAGSEALPNNRAVMEATARWAVNYLSLEPARLTIGEMNSDSITSVNWGEVPLFTASPAGVLSQHRRLPNAVLRSLSAAAQAATITNVRYRPNDVLWGVRDFLLQEMQAPSVRNRPLIAAGGYVHMPVPPDRVCAPAVAEGLAVPVGGALETLKILGVISDLQSYPLAINRESCGVVYELLQRAMATDRACRFNRPPRSQPTARRQQWLADYTANAVHYQEAHAYWSNIFRPAGDNCHQCFVTGMARIDDDVRAMRRTLRFYY